jgi:3-methylcrotonyl-CoA carboxylase alpha subunit
MPPIWRYYMDVLAGVQGIVVEVLVSPGSRVAAGGDMIVVESMKLEYMVKAPREGEVAEVLVALDDSVQEDTVVVRLTP